MNWSEEATYIEREIAREETSAQFNNNDATLCRYCVMQYHSAIRAGEQTIAQRIATAITREWPKLIL